MEDIKFELTGPTVPFTFEQMQEHIVGMMDTLSSEDRLSMLMKLTDHYHLMPNE